MSPISAAPTNMIKPQVATTAMIAPNDVMISPIQVGKSPKANKLTGQIQTGLSALPTLYIPNGSFCLSSFLLSV